jgi:signal transduction histidine kinase
MILGLGATAFAVVALTHLARTSREQRTVRAHDRVEAELYRLTELAPSLSHAQRMRHGRRGAGELRSGFVDGPGALDLPWVAELVGRVAAGSDTASEMAIEQSVTPDGTAVVAGAARVPGGGFVWAVQRVVVGPETTSLRVVVLCLALAMFVMVFASVQTLVAFDRGATALRESVVALASDLRAKVPRPRLRELAEVADGLDGLARELSRAQEDRVRLVAELAEHERWAALGRVVAGVAHEVRNPLAAIKLRTDLALVSADVPDQLRDDFALIGSEVARLDRLVRDLLLLADRKPGATVRVACDVAALVAARAALLRPWAAERRVSIAAEGSAIAVIDVDALTRAVDNLLRNAVEASPAGSEVTVVAREAAGLARVVVSDHGAGVANENAGLLFEPFFTTKASGTGLGLALSRAVAESHGGDLRFARVDGRTEFTLEVAKG